MTTDNPTQQKPEPPERVWLTRKEISGHQTWVQASGHDDDEYEYVRVPVAAQGDEGTSQVEQTIEGWRSQLTQDSFVSDEDAEDLILRLLAGR